MDVIYIVITVITACFKYVPTHNKAHHWVSRVQNSCITVGTITWFSDNVKTLSLNLNLGFQSCAIATLLLGDAFDAVCK